MPNMDVCKLKKFIATDKIFNSNDIFSKHIIKENALAISNIRAEKFDINKAKEKSHNAMVAMGIEGGLQAMLAAQMLSIHELQQNTMIYANAADNLELKKCYTNSAVKLANCFVQQANLLAKLQGVGGQKIIVERFDVHSGGRAIVGNIQGDMGVKKKT